MKKEFCGFYSTPDESLEAVWGGESTLFVLDANCLLNLYRCEDGTREDIIKVMKVLSPRIWIPFQVGYEYQKNRRNVIDDSISSLLKIKEELTKYYKQSILEQANIKKHLYNKLNSDISGFQESLQSNIDNFIAENIDKRIESKRAIANHDFIRDELDAIINENIGCLPTQVEIDEINKNGATRYENKIPPGFKDASKKGVSYFSGITIEDKFGDLYLWEQVIEKAKADNIDTVIFVTDDVKEDWVFIHKGKNRGPLESLKTEICKKANLNNFRLINQLSFLSEAKEYINGIDVSNETFNEVKELAMAPVQEDNEDYEVSDYYNYEINIHDDSEIDKNYKHPHNYYTHNKNTFHNNSTELVVRADNVYENYIRITQRASKNLNNISLFIDELNEMYGESSINSINRQILSAKKNAQSATLILKSKLTSGLKSHRINSLEILSLIEDAEYNNARLNDVNNFSETYLDTLL